MGKKRKSKVKKTDTLLETAAPTGTEKPQSNFYYGTNKFELPNEDAYVGEYCAHRNGMLWREGHGIYHTKDGQQYEGDWRDDKLIDFAPVMITYPNGDVFRGSLYKNKYESGGEVIWSDGLRLSANFQGNKPSGTFHVIDTLGQLWRGNADNDNASSKIFCRQEQVFFNNVHPLRGIKKEKLTEIEPIWAPQRSTAPSVSLMDEASAAGHVDPRELEVAIFGKKPKVGTKMDWEDSPWYRQYAQYKEKRQVVLSKIKNSQKLSGDELKWYCRYALARKRRQSESGERGKRAGRSTEDAEVDRTLLDKFYSTEHRQSAKPYSIFYPSYYWHTQVQPDVEEEVSSQGYTPIMEEISLTEEGSEEQSLGHIVATPDEEQISANPSIGCGTNSLYAFVKAATGARIINSCESVF